MQGGHGGGIAQNKDSQQVDRCGHGGTRTAGLGPCMAGDGGGRVKMGRTRMAGRGGSAGGTAVAERGQPAVGDHTAVGYRAWPAVGGRPRPNEDSRPAAGRAVLDY